MDTVTAKVTEVFQLVFPMIAEKNLNLAQLSRDDLESWNSMEHLNLLLSLEEAFEMTIPDEVAIKLNSFPAICDYFSKTAQK